jgi:hypothetical protein
VLLKQDPAAGAVSLVRQLEVRLLNVFVGELLEESGRQKGILYEPLEIWRFERMHVRDQRCGAWFDSHL